MLFKIILFLSHGCSAKTKRNLKWKGGWVGERGGCDWYKCSWLHANCPFAAQARASQQEAYTNISSALITVIRLCLNWSKELVKFPNFSLIHRGPCPDISGPLLWVHSSHSDSATAPKGGDGEGAETRHVDASPVLCPSTLRPPPPHSKDKNGRLAGWGLDSVLHSLSGSYHTIFETSLIHTVLKWTLTSKYFCGKTLWRKVLRGKSN